MCKVPARWWLWPGGSTRYGPRYTYFVPASAFVCELRSFALLLVVTVLVPLLLYCTDGTSTSTSTSTQIASIDFFLPLDRPGGPWAGSIFWALHQSNSLNLETKPRSRASIDHPGRGEAACLLACCLLLGCTRLLISILSSTYHTAEVPTNKRVAAVLTDSTPFSPRLRGRTGTGSRPGWL